MARRRKKSRLGGLVRGVLALAVIAGAGAVLLRVAGVELGFLTEGLFRTEEALPVQGEDSGAESAAGQPPADAPPVIRLAADTVWIHTGESYDPTANLSEVSDPEDGALSYLRTPSPRRRAATPPSPPSIRIRRGPMSPPSRRWTAPGT